MEEQKSHNQDEHHAHPESKVTVEHVERMAVEKGQPFSVPVAIIIAGAIIGAALYFGGNRSGVPSPSGIPGTPGEQAAPPLAGKAGVDIGTLPPLGDTNASVTIVEFSDFQCPFCRRFHETVFPNLKRDYIDSGKVRFAYRDFAFLGPESFAASNAARCANEQGKFWEYHDTLFAEQAGENQNAFSKENLKRFARDLRLDTAQFNSCVDSDKFADAVSADIAAGQQAGVQRTPATFVNGLLISGAQPYPEFQRVIEAELAQ